MILFKLSMHIPEDRTKYRTWWFGPLQVRNLRFTIQMSLASGIACLFKLSLHIPEDRTKHRLKENIRIKVCKARGVFSEQKTFFSGEAATGSSTEDSFTTMQARSLPFFMNALRKLKTHTSSSKGSGFEHKTNSIK